MNDLTYATVKWRLDRERHVRTRHWRLFRSVRTANRVSRVAEGSFDIRFEGHAVGGA